MNKTCAFLTLFLYAALCVFAQSFQDLQVGAPPVSGSLSHEGDEIWYRVRAAETGYLIVQTTGDTDTYLEAYDAQQNLLKQDDDGGEAYNARIELFVEAGRRYLFKLRGFGSTTGSFQISASFEAIPPSTELRFGSSQQGNLGAGAKHWYSVRVRDAGIVVVQTSGSIDTYMEAYDSRYNVIAEDDDSGSGYNARIEIIAEANQTYSFVVRGYSSQEAGSYSILANHEPIPRDERNTEISRAVAIRLGEAVPVFFLTPNESRWYRYEAGRAGTTFLVQTRGDLDTLLYLYDSQGTRISQNDDSGEGLNALISERLSQGTYFIEVRTYSDTIGRCTLHAETR